MSVSRRLFLGGAALAALPFASACPARRRGVSGAQALRAHAITLQIGHRSIAPKDYSPEALAQAIAASNEAARLGGLADDLNVEMLDGERVRAFVDGLARLPASSIAIVAGKTVRLNLPAMRLHAWSPVAAETLRRGFRLETGDNAANPHLANVRLVAPLDAAAGRATMLRARAYARDASHEATTRRAAAMTWLALADALRETAPADAGLRAQHEEARGVLDTIRAGPWTGGAPGGMP